jgi:hypothetical protein
MVGAVICLLCVQHIAKRRIVDVAMQGTVLALFYEVWV